MYKIGFLSLLNPFDVRHWSGTLFQITKQFPLHQVEWIGEGLMQQISTYSSRYKGHFYIEKYAEVFGRLLSERLKDIDVDLLLVRDNSLGAYLKIDVPILFIGDTTANEMKDYFNVKEKTHCQIVDNVEKAFLEKVDTIIYSSHWAAQDAISYYGIPPKKIHVVEFGANIPNPPKYQLKIDTNVCNLVFIGRNWEKKGGEKVLRAFRKLKEEGLSCTLTIIGSVPPEILAEEKDLTIIPFLDKSQSEKLNKLCDILHKSHFLVLPTEFDAFGIVFCEASAYGVPSIAANVGGVCQPIREGVNGFLLPPDATAEEYAEKIKLVFSDKENYLKLRTSSRREYENRLNWDVWGEKVNKIVEDTVENNRRKKHGRASK